MQYKALYNLVSLISGPIKCHQFDPHHINPNLYWLYIRCFNVLSSWRSQELTFCDLGQTPGDRKRSANTNIASNSQLESGATALRSNDKKIPKSQITCRFFGGPGGKRVLSGPL